MLQVTQSTLKYVLSIPQDIIFLQNGFYQAVESGVTSRV